MMTFLTSIIIIGLMLMVGLWLKRLWEERQAAPLAASAPTAIHAEPSTNDVAVSNRVVQYTNVLRNRVSDVQATLFGAKQPVAAVPFRAWVASLPGTEVEVRSWLATLSDEQLNALAAHIERFTHEMGFELSWLLNQEVAQQPTLARALTRVVLDYCHACYQAVLLQEDLEIYKTLRGYKQNPDSPQNREFGQALFGKLLEQGLTSIKVADHMALPERQRRQQIVETINQVAAEKQAVLLRIVQEMMTHHNGAAAAAPVPTAALNGAAHQVKA